MAKFRAGRKVWATNLRDRYGITKDSDLMLKGLFAGGGSGLTKAEPENNIMRGAFYALAAALSGAQSTALCSFDEAYSIPTERAALLSLRTLQILMEEVGLRDTVDPLAGSYFIETITKQMEDKIWEEMKEIEKLGGMVRAVARELSSQGGPPSLRMRDGRRARRTHQGGREQICESEEDVALHDYREEDARGEDQRPPSPSPGAVQRGSLPVTESTGANRPGKEKRHALSGGLLPGLLHGR